MSKKKQPKEVRKQERLRRLVQRREPFAKMFFKRWCLFLLGAVLIGGIGTYGFYQYKKLSVYQEANRYFVSVLSDMQLDAGYMNEIDFIQSAGIDLTKAVNLMVENITGICETSYMLINAETGEQDASSRLAVFFQVIIDEEEGIRMLYSCPAETAEQIYEDYMAADELASTGITAYAESYYLWYSQGFPKVVPAEVVFKDTLGETKKIAGYLPEEGISCPIRTVPEGSTGRMVFYGQGLANQADTLMENYVLERVKGEAVCSYEDEVPALPFGTIGFYFQRETYGGAYYLCGMVIYHMLEDIGYIFVIAYILLFLLATGLAFVFSWRTHTLLKVRYQMEDERRRLTNAMAHDLKSPLMAISGYAENLKDHVHTEKREHYAEAITDSVRYMNGIISNVLDLAKLEEGNIKFEKEPIELMEVARELAKRYQPELEKKKVSLEIKGECRVQGNRQLLTQALDNLISNSVKYTPPVGSIIAEGSGSRFSIQNDSSEQPGVAPEALLQPFVKGDNSRGNLRGSGIGLAIVKSIADLHGFEMNIDCSENRFMVEWKEMQPQ